MVFPGQLERMQAVLKVCVCVGGHPNRIKSRFLWLSLLITIPPPPEKVLPSAGAADMAQRTMAMRVSCDPSSATVPWLSTTILSAFLRPHAQGLARLTTQSAQAPACVPHLLCTHAAAGRERLLQLLE
jgi:hypothetical protein